MRFFKKEGNLKFRKTDDSKVADEWLEAGWGECDKNGVLVVSNAKIKKEVKTDKK